MNSHYIHSQMLIMLVVNLIGRVQVALAKSLQDVSYPSLQGSKGQLHCSQLKQNILLMEVVAHKFSESNINYMIMNLH